MTFSNITALNLGSLLQIAYSMGVRNQLSEDYREFEQIKKWRVGNTQARQVNFQALRSYGPSAIQYRNPGSSGRAFPTAKQSTLGEYTAYFKEIDATIEVEYNMYDRALSSPEKYGEPLALEIENKAIAARRRIAADWYGDGTGVLGQAASVDDTLINTSTGATPYSVVVTMASTTSARGSVGMFEFGELILCKQAAGTARTPAAGSNFAAYKCIAKNRKAGTVTLSLVQSDGDTAATGYTSSGIVAGDVFYKNGQPTFADLSTTITDYGTATEVFAGIESLAAGDGRTVHGMVMTGALAGTRVSGENDPLDARMLQEALDQVKVNVGQSRYRYAKACSSPENNAKFINSRETDRRFVEINDAKRGLKAFGYVHGNDTVELYTAEFAHPKRIIGLPELASGEKVLEYYGSDFKPVTVKGSDPFMLKPASGGGHTSNVVSYLHGIMVMLCRHPAAVWTLENFS